MSANKSCMVSVGNSDGEEDDQQDDEPRERIEVAEARDVFGESDEEEDQDAEHEPEQEAEGRRSPEESLQGSPEVFFVRFVSSGLQYQFIQSF